MQRRRTALRVLGAIWTMLPVAGRAAFAATGAAASAPSPARACAAALSRRFADPLLEAARLLRLAAGIEHATLLQYLYSAFSLKDDYATVGEYDASGTTTNLLAIAIDRMTHFNTINRVLVTLGAPPQLAAPDFPVDTGVYPFALELEPLGRVVLAQYLYRDAPPGAFADSADAPLMQEVCRMLGIAARPGMQLYAVIAATLEEANHVGGGDLPDLARWAVALRQLDQRGSEARFDFVKSVFLGAHPAFAGRGDVWNLPADDPRFPAYDIVRGDGACAALPAGAAPSTDGLMRLGDLQYGTTLLLLDLYFRQHLPIYRSLAVAHMIGPVQAIGRHLPRLGVGMPFRAIGVPDSSGLDAQHRLRFILALLNEAQDLAETLRPLLPPRYPMTVDQETAAALRATALR